MQQLVVTRHQGLVDFLVNEGHVSSEAEVVEHATEENVTGRHVWGVLPHALSCLTRSFTEVPLSLPAELRGTELTESQVRQYAGEPTTYFVRAFAPQNARECTCGSGLPWTQCGSTQYCG